MDTTHHIWSFFFLRSSIKTITTFTVQSDTNQAAQLFMLAKILFMKINNILKSLVVRVGHHMTCLDLPMLCVWSLQHSVLTWSFCVSAITLIEILLLSLSQPDGGGVLTPGLEEMHFSASKQVCLWVWLHWVYYSTAAAEMLIFVCSLALISL